MRPPGITFLPNVPSDTKEGVHSLSRVRMITHRCCKLVISNGPWGCLEFQVFFSMHTRYDSAPSAVLMASLFHYKTSVCFVGHDGQQEQVRNHAFHFSGQESYYMGVVGFDGIIWNCRFYQNRLPKQYDSNSIKFYRSKKALKEKA